MSNDSSFTIDLPDSVRSDIVEAVEAEEYPDWVYPATLDESLDEYVAARKGRFDRIGFDIFPDERVAGVHRDSPIDLPPAEVRAVIEEHRRAVFRENYTLRFEFADDSWETVTDVRLEAYFVITEPTDL